MGILPFAIGVVDELGEAVAVVEGDGHVAQGCDPHETGDLGAHAFTDGRSVIAYDVAVDLGDVAKCRVIWSAK